MTAPVDLTGRLPIRFKNNRFPFIYLYYHEQGQPFAQQKKVLQVQQLHKHTRQDIELFPNRTVVQFNSTYMELIGRNDNRRGDAVAWVGGLLILGGWMTLGFGMMFISSIINGDPSWFTIIMLCFTLGMVLMDLFMLLVLSTEMFTVRYFPIRFNRRTRQVHVWQANRQVDTFDWDELHFFITTLKDGYDLRGVVLAEDDNKTITKLFALPVVPNALPWNYDNHFEFIKRYMSGDEQDLIEAKNAIRYIYPIHEKCESPIVSLKRVFLHEFYTSDKSLELPRQSSDLKIDIVLILFLPIIGLRYIGRVISMLTCYRPKFSAQIEAQSQIDPQDPHDLNKHLPEVNLEEQNKPLWHRVALSFFIVIFVIATLFVSAFVIDFMAWTLKEERPDNVGMLIDIFTLQWLPVH